MAIAGAQHSKKCPHCQQWSAWQLRADDRCEHCGQLLDPRAYQSQLLQAERASQKPPALLLVEVSPTDRGLKRLFKTIVRNGQLAFAAIMTFFVWLATIVVG